MADLDPDNYIKLFRLDDNQDSTYPGNVVIIPAGKNVFRSMFHSESRERQQATTMETNGFHFPEEGVNLLIKFRHELEELFRDCGDIPGIAAVLWEDISRRLFERGFTVSAKQCATKWETLYSEYLELAQSDDEGKVSGSKHFTAIENLYKLRTKYIDSKILEDITEFLRYRRDCPSTSAETSRRSVRSDERIEARRPSKNGLTKEDFSTLKNEDDSEMLMEAIDAAQKILDENLRDPDNETSQGYAQTVKIDPVKKTSCRYKKRKKHGSKKSPIERETSLFLEEKNMGDISREVIASKTIIHSTSAEKQSEDQVFMRSENTDFYWDTDATQCFLDLRLYVEANKKTKQSILRIYTSIVKFVSQKMLKNGFKVSEIDCRKKWEQLMRYYNREIQRMKKIPLVQNRPQGVKTYFWQMDKVLKKSGLEMSADNTGDFIWGQESIRKLIAIRMPMEDAFSMFKRYVILWQYVASQMQQYNFLPTYHECSIKWMEICEIYQICLDSIRRGAKETDIGWNFYQEMRQGFESNAKSTEAVINYKCNVGAEDQATVAPEHKKKSTESLATCTSSSASKILVQTEFDALSTTEDLNIENRTNQQHVETGAGQNALEAVIQHCNILENMPKVGETNATDNELADGSRTPNAPQIDNNIKIINLGASYSLDSKGNLQVESANPKSCIQLPRNSGLKSSDVLEVKSPFDIRISTSSTTFNKKQSTVGWTDEATTLMIKVKISRELKFRSSLYREMDLWKEIATDMQTAGYNMSHESCSARWYQLMDAYKKNSSSENPDIISQRYREQLKLIELPLMKNTSTARAPNTEMNRNNINSTATKFVWTDTAVKTLIGLKFSEEIRHLKIYSLAIVNEMRASGFPTITRLDVSKKWSRLYTMYKKTLFRQDIGHYVTWEYFELIHKYMKDSTSDRKFEVQKTVQPYSWTPKAVQKLIEVKLLLENSWPTLNHKTLPLLWKKIAEAMVEAGFQVTPINCATEWSFLVQSYMKTKKELRTGNGAVIGKYFIMMDKALNLLNKLNNNEKETEAPIDFSIASGKREPEDSGEENRANIDQSFDTMSFEENMSDTFRKKFTENQKQDKSHESIGDNAINLSLKIAVPSLNCTSVDSSTEITEMPENNNNVDSSHVFNLNKEKDIYCNLISTMDRTQQEEGRVSLYNEACSSTDHQMIVNNDHVDSSKENVTCIWMETRSKSRENMQSRILLNSLGNIEGGESNRRWSEAGTHLLIDSVGWPRCEINWNRIATQLARLGYNYTSEECRAKWYSLKTTYEQKKAEIQAKRAVETWPYFERMDLFYKRCENLGYGFRYILPKKRPHNGEKQRLTPPKKLAVSMKASESCFAPSHIIDNVGILAKPENIVVHQEKIIQ